MPNKDGTSVAESLPLSPADEAPAWARMLIDRMDRLETQVQEARSAAPRFQPMAPPQARQPRGIFAGMSPPPGGAVEREGVSKSVWVDERGHRVPEMLLRQYPPRFEAGDPCRIDPDSSREGWPDGRTWGEVLAKHNSPGLGVIRKVYWLRDTGEWKYAAVIRGITNQRPDGFLDRELLPA